MHSVMLLRGMSLVSAQTCLAGGGEPGCAREALGGGRDEGEDQDGVAARSSRHRQVRNLKNFQCSWWLAGCFCGSS